MEWVLFLALIVAMVIGFIDTFRASAQPERRWYSASIMCNHPPTEDDIAHLQVWSFQPGAHDYVLFRCHHWSG